MKTPQTAAPAKVMQVPVSSVSMISRQPLTASNKPQDMVVRHPAPDASVPMKQTEHKAFSLSY